MADIKPSGFFADGMVIQRETNAGVWGWADSGGEVTATGGCGEAAKSTPDEAGKWLFKLKAPRGCPHTITLKGDNLVELRNVSSLALPPLSTRLLCATREPINHWSETYTAKQASQRLASVPIPLNSCLAHVPKQPESATK
ncbi:MAG: hypothetical protein ABGY95_03510 [Rubritalea sp.]|uniref:hypothetical protein n=1 Tax=Rubritalea sp. TaxID=2109375 RepID=UPI003242102C